MKALSYCKFTTCGFPSIGLKADEQKKPNKLYWPVHLTVLIINFCLIFFQVSKLVKEIFDMHHTTTFCGIIGKSDYCSTFWVFCFKLTYLDFIIFFFSFSNPSFTKAVRHFPLYALLLLTYFSRN